MPSLRFGCHDFLNAQPLLRNLQDRAEALNLEIYTGAPGELADRLYSGDLDLAMIPSYEYLKKVELYRILPGVCIASRGEVGSVFLVTKEKELSQIKTVAVDRRSRTSVAALKVLFGGRFDENWSLRPTEPDLKAMLSRNSAALIIGDPALEIDRSKTPYTIFDLSEEWLHKTGKSFVHAVVAIREGVVIPNEIKIAIQNAAQKEEKQIETICREYAGNDEQKLAQYKDYFLTKISYHLGSEEVEGLIHFQKMCKKMDGGTSQQDYTWESIE